jgi:hypothetical protein
LWAKVAVDRDKVGAKGTGICYAAGNDGLSKLEIAVLERGSGVLGLIREWIIEEAAVQVQHQGGLFIEACDLGE